MHFMFQELSDISILMNRLLGRCLIKYQFDSSFASSLKQMRYFYYFNTFSTCDSLSNCSLGAVSPYRVSL